MKRLNANGVMINFFVIYSYIYIVRWVFLFKSVEENISILRQRFSPFFMAWSLTSVTSRLFVSTTEISACPSAFLLCSSSSSVLSVWSYPEFISGISFSVLVGGRKTWPSVHSLPQNSPSTSSSSSSFLFGVCSLCSLLFQPQIHQYL